MAACASGRNESPLNISEIDFTPCLDEKQHETFRGRLAPVDMDAFIDEEFGKIYEGEEMYSDTAPKYDSNQWPTETQSGLLEQIQCLNGTGALLSGPDGVFEMSGCGLGEEERLEESRSHEAHVCCPCKFKKSTCSMETVERAGNPSETITLDNDKGSIFCCYFYSLECYKCILIRFVYCRCVFQLIYKRYVYCSLAIACKILTMLLKAFNLISLTLRTIHYIGFFRFFILLFGLSLVQKLETSDLQTKK